MEWVLFVQIVLSAASLGLAGLLWSLRFTSPFYRSVATVIGLTGLIGAGSGLTFIDADRALLWRSLIAVVELLQPAAILYVCVALVYPIEADLHGPTLWRARTMTGIGSLLALLFCGAVIFAGASGGSLSGVDLQTLDHVISSFIIVGLVVDLAYLEQCLRLLRDPLRYRLKLILIGVGALAVVRIYHVSQVLGMPVEEVHAVLISGFGSLIAIGLIAVGLVRARLRETVAAVYVAPGVLYGSMTFLVVGVYLFAVGMVGEFIRYSGLPLGDVLSQLVVFMAAIALVVVLVSRSVRARMLRWIARRFYRAKYDYRAKWLEVADAFQSCHTTKAVLDQLLDILSRTFSAPRISVWIQYESDGQFHMVRSTNMELDLPPLADAHPVVSCLRGSDEPVAAAVLESSPGWRGGQFQVCTQAEVCVPIQSSGELLGFVVLGRDERGEPYHNDDYMLLRAIAHHIGMLLALSRHTEERRAAVGLEALHRFSAFCLHDLKNLTAGLSLVVQNADVHGHDPAFQKSAMKTVSGTVNKMLQLMDKLSLKARSEMSGQTLDLGPVLSDTVHSLKIPVRADLSVLGDGPLLVRAVREELQQVFLNLLLNARQAAGEQGLVSIACEVGGGIVTVRVTDNGPGIPPARLQTLFHPFQTTKAGGLGIGLYQCKRILESHHGSIRVLSEVGEGTTIYIELPIVDEASQPRRADAGNQRADLPGGACPVATGEEGPGHA
jgi:putative PEP-CTERM system histidine kinase